MNLFMKLPLRIAVAQMNILQSNKEWNLQQARKFIEQAASDGVELVCLPEAFATGVNFMDLHKMAEGIPDGVIFHTLVDLATINKIHIVAGIVEKDEHGRIFDSAVIISDKGALLGKYQRRFLWTGENNYFSQGMPMYCINSNIGRIGLLVGYDIFFPEACHNYFLDDVDLLICVANVFEELSNSAQQLCRARSIENHCYFIFTSGIGEHNLINKKYMGVSMITCDPYYITKQLKRKQSIDMDILCKAGTSEVLLSRDIYIEEMKKYKKKVPFLSDLKSALEYNVKK